MKNNNKKHFTIKDAYYQSWMVSKQEKGTNVYVLLTDINKNVVFDSIIFRGVQMPISIEVKEGITMLRGTINIDASRLEKESAPTNKPDQIIYRFKGQTNSFILEKLRRESMKYIKI